MTASQLTFWVTTVSLQLALLRPDMLQNEGASIFPNVNEMVVLSADAGTFASLNLMVSDSISCDWLAAK